MSRFDERTSIVVTANLAFGEWPPVHDCGNVGSLQLDDHQMQKQIYTDLWITDCDLQSCVMLGGNFLVLGVGNNVRQLRSIDFTRT